MIIPFELIQIIYNYSDIDTKQSFNKIFNHQSFLHSKLSLSDSTIFLFNQLVSFKYTNFIVIRELNNNFLLI